MANDTDENPRLITFAEAQQRYGGGGGASFLSANTARVDPSGDDSTAIVGDLTKPFLTVQGALDAIVALDPQPDMAIIDIGGNRFTESLTITAPMPVLLFKGAANQGPIDNSDIGQVWNTLTITDDGNDSFFIFLKDCYGDTIATDSELTLMLDSAQMNNGGITSTLTGSSLLTVGSIYGTGSEIGAIVAVDADILVFGVTPADSSSTISTDNGAVTVSGCGQAPDSDLSYALKCFSINAPAGSVTVNDSLLKDVTHSGLALVRSKVLGTVTPMGNPPVSHSDDQGPYAYIYDFDLIGGAQGTVYLNPNPGSQGGALAAGFVITRAILEVITPLDSASHLATVALSSGESAGDLQVATVVSGAPWSTPGLKNITALFKTTGSDNPTIEVAVQDLTAGKFTLHFEGYLDS